MGAAIREMLRANPDQMAMLKQNNPKLSEALESGDLEAFAKVLKEQQDARKEREQMRIRMMNADPFDMEAQRLIQQEIEQKNIDHNMELAMEASPESFGTVIMLYINCKVNGHDVKAFVDSGAQATIMSQAAAERCGIMRLVDTRWAGIANLVKMGFPREVAIAELRKCNGDANLAIANLFAKSLSEGFNKKK